jgi:hypothetical protein
VYLRINPIVTDLGVEMGEKWPETVPSQFPTDFKEAALVEWDCRNAYDLREHLSTLQRALCLNACPALAVSVRLLALRKQLLAGVYENPLRLRLHISDFQCLNWIFAKG